MGINGDLIEFSRYFVTVGAACGGLTALFFLVLHEIVLGVPIWFLGPIGIIFGILTGTGLAYSYKVYFQEFNLRNTVKLHLIYLLPIIVLLVGTLLFFEPVFTAEEANDPNNSDQLLALAFSIAIPYSLVYGVVQGLVYKRSRNTLLASIFTNFIILTGIGHNFPLFMLVEFDPDGSIILTELRIFSFLLLLIAFFIATIHLVQVLMSKYR